MFKYCPACASEKLDFSDKKAFRCPDCGFVYYHNTAAATGCVISSGERLLLLVRDKEPGKGMLDLPGGFVDAGEGALEGLYREIQEELGWSPPVPGLTASDTGAPLTDIFTLIASFPNVYPYKGIPYNTCDLYFSLCAPGLRIEDLRPRQGEIAAIRLVKPEEIDFNEFAFDSTRRAVRAYLNSLD